MKNAASGGPEGLFYSLAFKLGLTQTRAFSSSGSQCVHAVWDGTQLGRTTTVRRCERLASEPQRDLLVIRDLGSDDLNRDLLAQAEVLARGQRSRGRVG